MDDPNNRRRRRGQATEQTGAEFDAAPNNFDSSFGTQPGDGLEPDQDLPAPVRRGAKNQKPRNIRETRVWKEAADSVRRFWGNYVNALKIAFNRFDRRGQEELIIRLSQIMTLQARPLLRLTSGTGSCPRAFA